MFCYQCEETAGGKGCTKGGVCGKPAEVAELQDLLIHVLKGMSFRSLSAERDRDVEDFIVESLFSTITNVNFDADHFTARIWEALDLRDSLPLPDGAPEAAVWRPADDEELRAKAKEAGVLATEDEDVRSLRELLVYGLKGMAAYYSHAQALGFEDPAITEFMRRGLASTLEDLDAETMVGWALDCGRMGVDTMALLDKANTSTYGDPEVSAVSIGVRDRPGILVSGHDLKDLEMLLQQTEGTGVDVYTHGEMLPCNAYPVLKGYEHLAGNYGGSWWRQKEEFDSFNGPVLLTTNCLVPPSESYADRIFMTGAVGFPGLKRIEADAEGRKDFTPLVEMALSCDPPQPLEEGEITIGLARKTLAESAGKLLELVSQGRLRRFMVMAGCDGRRKDREYYTEFAKALPEDVMILTAGCAKYRYNKLPLGDIDGIPRVVDAGQCNDSYSLAATALALAEALGVDVNELPISYNIAWYEQKAVLVLLSLLSLGIKDITLGPRLPAFVSPGVLDVLVDKFNIRKNSDVEGDMRLLLPEEGP